MTEITRGELRDAPADEKIQLCLKIETGNDQRIETTLFVTVALLAF